MKKILVIFGTRPEAIKLFPVIKRLKKENCFELKVCNTSQHIDMLDHILEILPIKIDYNLQTMQHNQGLFDISISILTKIKPIFDDFHPDAIIVQGDTSTAFISSLAAFYNQIDIIHIEAGLRTYDIYNPFPEEINRVFISKIAKIHFAPTKQAKKNLLKENVKNIKVTGNTGIDTLFWTLKHKNNFEFDFLKRDIILVTLHRRENIKKLKNICLALKEIAKNDINIVFPVHLNPKVRKIVFSILKNISNIYLIEPLRYDKFIALMDKAKLIITDSGGIQEEAVSLNKPLIVTRKKTERVEILKFKNIHLVGTNSQKIICYTNKLLKKEKKKKRIHTYPFGKGKASKKIVKYLKEFYCE